MLIESDFRIDEIVHFDTGIEHDEMYVHIEKVKEMIKPYEITTLKPEKSFEYYLLEHEKTRGKNKGQKGYSFPDFRNRWCTTVLKKGIVKKYIAQKYKDEMVVEVHGIALDEIERTKKNNEKEIIYPLVEWELTEKDCLEYCYEKGLDWGGLYEKLPRVSCWCCPLQRMDGLRYLYHEKPEQWEKLKEWESKTYRTFRPNKTLLEIEEKFKKEDEKKKPKQTDIFDFL